MPTFPFVGHYLPIAGGTAHAQAGTHTISVDLSGVDTCVGALRLEGRRGALMSNTLSVLMMPCAASAAEVCQLEVVKGKCLPRVPAQAGVFAGSFYAGSGFAQKLVRSFCRSRRG